VHLHSCGASAIPVEIGSRNIYRDLGFPDADELFLKAGLVTALSDIIAARDYNPSEVHARCGCSARTLRRLRRGRFHDTPVGDLVGMIRRLELRASAE
jgi:hypothetical protein